MAWASVLISCCTCDRAALFLPLASLSMGAT